MSQGDKGGHWFPPPLQSKWGHPPMSSFAGGNLDCSLCPTHHTQLAIVVQATLP